MIKTELQPLSEFIKKVLVQSNTEVGPSEAQQHLNPHTEELATRALCFTVIGLLESIQYFIDKQGDADLGLQLQFEQRLNGAFYALMFALVALEGSEEIALEVSGTHVVLPEGNIVPRAEVSNRSPKIVSLSRFQEILSAGGVLKTAV